MCKRNALLTLASYPELRAALGGAAAVPDFRGLFLRGVGGNSAAIGVQQDMEIQSHSHTSEGIWNYNGGGGSGARKYLMDQGKINVDFAGGVETRPVNKAVRYLIRALP
jgi:hypothetical protein